VDSHVDCFYGALYYLLHAGDRCASVQVKKCVINVWRSCDDDHSVPNVAPIEYERTKQEAHCLLTNLSFQQNSVSVVVHEVVLKFRIPVNRFGV
jgi:hypothetical protein